MLASVRRLATSVGIALTALSCGGGGDDTTGPPAADAVVGVYTLATANGQALPVVIERSGDDTAEITQGVVTLNADRTFTDVTQLRFTISGNVTSETESASGTWTRTATTVQFNATGFSPYTMTWDGANRLTQIIGTLTLVYTK